MSATTLRDAPLPNYSNSSIELEGVLSFPKVFEPEEPPGGGPPRYSCALLLDPADKEQLQLIESAITAAIAKKWRGQPPTGLQMPLRDGNEKSYTGYKGKIYLNLATHDRPSLFAWQTRRPATPDDVVAGYTVLAGVNAFGYDNVSKGVSFALNVLWVLRRGERLDGRPSEAQKLENLGTRGVAGRKLMIEDGGSGSEVPTSTVTGRSSAMADLMRRAARPD